jgi:hypothetical protein
MRVDAIPARQGIIPKGHDILAPGRFGDAHFKTQGQWLALIIRPRHWHLGSVLGFEIALKHIARFDHMRIAVNEIPALGHLLLLSWTTLRHWPIWCCPRGV